MALTAEEAADIALEAGLSVADAAALRALGCDATEARAIAAKFKNEALDVGALVDTIPPQGGF